MSTKVADEFTHIAKRMRELGEGAGDRGAAVGAPGASVPETSVGVKGVFFDDRGNLTVPSYFSDRTHTITWDNAAYDKAVATAQEAKVERMAIAAYAVGFPTGTWGNAMFETKDFWRKVIRAALAAADEPA